MPYTQVYQPLNILPLWIYCSLDFTIQIYICISIFAHFSELFGNELQTSCTFTPKYFSVYILKIKNNFFHNHSTTKKIRKFYIDTMTVTLNPYSNVTSYSNNACYNVFFLFLTYSLIQNHALNLVCMSLWSPVGPIYGGPLAFLCLP